ncbi:septum formation protein Maf [Palleronia sediminis]|uniref:Nucleoside triphosphate pyrophosphatase n=1 Tax=Palleronia sediminis TaxID=2547833 RepID=A0A4R6A6H8_9RHOB|nr:Maf family protein [Palleronia sediminis]TDL78324.1 septum formation protein Maf [Palleronia sediminis]
MRLILASGSATRAALLTAARVPFETVVPRVDEETVKAALLAENAAPRDIADALAEAKARKVSTRHPGAVALGCDQVLEHRGRLMSKPADPEAACAQIARLAGDRHRLLSACVAYEDGAPVWRHVGEVRMTMRALSPGWIEGYVARNWPAIGECVGAYRLEDEGARLFTAVEGDYFTVLGMPLLPLLSWLTLRGYLDT